MKNSCSLPARAYGSRSPDSTPLRTSDCIEMRPLMGLPAPNRKSLTKLSDAGVIAADVDLMPVRLDPLTVVDDDQWVKNLGKQRNLPAEIKAGLKAMYS